MRKILVALIISLPVSIFVAEGANCAEKVLKTARVETVVQPPLPAFAQDGLYSGLYLDIDKVMADEHLTRLQAVETQYYLRRYMEKSEKLKATPQFAYDAAISRVRRGVMESVIKPIEFKHKADYAIALDMDETILVQWYQSGDRLKDLTVGKDSVGVLESGRAISVVKNFDLFLNKIMDHKTNPHFKGLIIFSAKADDPAHEIVEKLTLPDGTKLKSLVNYIFTRSHLVIGKFGRHAVTIPSKDLRIIDETLQHIVLVDDNPARVLQPMNLRAQPKYDADQYVKVMDVQTPGSAEQTPSNEFIVKNHFERILPDVATEIIESALAAERLGISFAQAFSPYSYEGNRIFQSFRNVLPLDAALVAARQNMSLHSAAFVPANPTPNLVPAAGK